MTCPVCTAPVESGQTRCPHCGAATGLPGQPVPQTVPHNPVWPVWCDARAVGHSTVSHIPQKQALPVRTYLAALLLGFLPLAGIVYNLVLAFGKETQPEKKNLAKALLWLHGVALVAGIVCLCIWVFSLAARI